MRTHFLVSAFLGLLLCAGSLPGRAQGSAGANAAVLRSVSAAGPASAAAANSAAPAVDLPTLRGQLQQFQQVLNRDLQQTFGHPFAVLQDAKGIYLPRFGVAFHMEINLVPMRTISPFDVRPYTEEELRKTRETKLDRIRQLKDHLSDLLLQHGDDFAALSPEHNVAVVVHLFHLPSEQTQGLPSQLVIEAPRRALLDSVARKLPPEDFRKQVTFLEF